jgi:polyisoprenoid-binding protein YceI
MKDKTVTGGITLMIVGIFFIGIVWFLFLRKAPMPTAPITAIPINILGDSDNFTIFELTSTESNVTFAIDETLRGLPTTVIGSSRQVAGQIAIDFTNPANSQVGPIRINARTLLTNNEFRDNAIQNFILDTQSHEFIIFTPTNIIGLPTTFIPNEPVALQIEGDLTIKSVTQTAVFTATITPITNAQLTGTASTQLLRSDFNLTIPDAPGVANVSDEVTLTIDFSALPFSPPTTE